MVAPTNAFLGSYQLLETIGRGGMAEVFRARYRGAAGAQREVVIKRMLPFSDEERGTFEKLFVSEAKLTLQLSHGNIVQVFDFGEEDGQYYLVMELVDGVSLATLMSNLAERGVKVLPPGLAALVMIEVAKGLHYAHTRAGGDGKPLNIVHRDVSPDNVLMGRDGQVKVADFGIARAAMAGRTRTAPGIFRGKPSFSAPEQLRSEAIDARADVYPCAIMLWNLITGQNPQGDLGIPIAIGARTLPPLPLDLMGQELSAIIERATAAEPEARTATAQLLQVELERWVIHQPVPSPHTAIVQLVGWAMGVPPAPAFEAWVRDQQPRQTERVASSRATVKTEPDRPAVTPVPRKRAGLIAAAVALAVGVVLVVGLLTAESEAPLRGEAQPIEPEAAPAPPPPPPPVARPSPAPEVPPPAPESSGPVRRANGVPARIALTSTAHGLDLKRAGLRVEGTPGHWGVRLRQSRGEPLYFIPLDGTKDRSPLLVGEMPVAAPGEAGRVFFLHPPGWTPPNKWNPDVQILARVGKSNIVTKVHRGALSETTVFPDEHVFRLESLSATARYRVTSLRGPPVIVIARPQLRPAFDLTPQQLPSLSTWGPPRQTMLQSGGSIEVRKVSGLWFVVPYFDDEPERRVELTVEEVGAATRAGARPVRAEPEPRIPPAALVPGAPLPPSPAGTLDSLTIEADLKTAKALMAAKRYGEAIPHLERCLKLDPDHPDCEELLQRARGK